MIDIEKLNLYLLSSEEIYLIDGGNFFHDVGEAIGSAAAWVCNAAEDVANFVTEVVQNVVEYNEWSKGRID